MNKEQYETIIAALIEKITAQQNEITVQKWQLEKLEKQLKEAEALLPKPTLETK